MNEFSAASFSFVRCKEYLGVNLRFLGSKGGIMATRSRRSLRGRLTDSQRDEMLIRMVDQLDSLHIRLSNEQEAIQAPQYPMYEWARGLLERRHEVCDTAGDITKIVRMEVTNFEGKVDATQFVDWLVVIEEYFNWYDMMDDRRVRFTKMKLVGLAKVWWTGIEGNNSRMGLPPISTRQEMKAKLREKYMPINYYDKLCDQLINLRQNNMPVVEYIQKFDKLKTRSQIVEDHRQTLARFKAGLRSEIKRELLHQPLYSLEHAFQVALEMEEYVGHSSHRKPEAMTMESAQKKLHDTSRSVKPGSSHPFNPPTGFKSSSSQVVDPKAPKMEEEDWRRTSIFQMLVQCGNQAQKLIIDSDSCMNVVLASMVERLKLPVEPHPQPYKVAWINNMSIPVNQSHIILGRPWLYDRDVHHCGKENTYSFMFKNQKVVLKPMTVAEMGKYQIQKSTKVVEGMKRSLHILTKNKFQHESKENGVIYAVIMKKVGSISSIPKKAAELLNDFSDIGPVDLPSELPPLHNIQHSIDFMSGSQLPNFPAYRMNPIEWQLAPIPRLDDMLDMMAGSYIFSKIDLKRGYHQIQLRPEDEWKTAFKIKDGLEVDPNKVKAILEWPVPSTLSFSTIMAPITDCRKKNQFKRLTEALVLQLPDFSKVFEVACDALNVGIGGVLSQERHPIAFFSEKLNEAKQKYSIYDKEYYVVVQTLHYWCHYLLPKGFVLYFDHEALKYVNSQKKLNHRHGKWVSLLQEYTFVIRHKSGVENKATDALSQVVYILSSMAIQALGFDLLKWDYNSCKDFNILYDALAAGIAGAYPDFSLHDGYITSRAIDMGIAFWRSSRSFWKR
ncbi:hypothetical protein AAG906_018817 [Vitis piasezkii]